MVGDRADEGWVFGLLHPGVAEGRKFLELVGVPSSQNAAISRVAPTDPDNSYLIQKLEGNAGTQMPLGGAALDPAVIAEIRLWITNGALRQ